jgi:hypothetical protein
MPNEEAGPQHGGFGRQRMRVDHRRHPVHVAGHPKQRAVGRCGGWPRSTRSFRVARVFLGRPARLVDSAFTEKEENDPTGCTTATDACTVVLEAPWRGSPSQKNAPALLLRLRRSHRSQG